MKKTVLPLLVVCVCFGCADRPPKVKTPPTQKTISSINTVDKGQAVEMTIEGMMCAIGCAATIEKKLQTTQGVTSAAVDFDSKLAKITFDPSQINHTIIEEVITNAGPAYQVSAVNLVD